MGFESLSHEEFFSIRGFSGKNAESWLELMDDDIYELQIPFSKQVSYACQFLLGMAELWFKKNFHRISVMNWCDFSYNVLWEFGDANQRPCEGILQKLSGHERGEQLEDIKTDEIESVEKEVILLTEESESAQADGGEKRVVSVDSNLDSLCNSGYADPMLPFTHPTKSGSIKCDSSYDSSSSILLQSDDSRHGGRVVIENELIDVQNAQGRVKKGLVVVKDRLGYGGTHQLFDKMLARDFGFYGSVIIGDVGWRIQDIQLLYDKWFRERYKKSKMLDVREEKVQPNPIPAVDFIASGMIIWLVKKGSAVFSLRSRVKYRLHIDANGVQLSYYTSSGDQYLLMFKGGTNTMFQQFSKSNYIQDQGVLMCQLFHDTSMSMIEAASQHIQADAGDCFEYLLILTYIRLLPWYKWNGRPMLMYWMCSGLEEGIALSKTPSLFSKLYTRYLPLLYTYLCSIKGHVSGKISLEKRIAGIVAFSALSNDFFNDKEVCKSINLAAAVIWEAKGQVAVLIDGSKEMVAATCILHVLIEDKNNKGRLPKEQMKMLFTLHVVGKKQRWDATDNAISSLDSFQLAMTNELDSNRGFQTICTPITVRMYHTHVHVTDYVVSANLKGGLTILKCTWTSVNISTAYTDTAIWDSNDKTFANSVVASYEKIVVIDSMECWSKNTLAPALGVWCFDPGIHSIQEATSAFPYGQGVLIYILDRILSLLASYKVCIYVYKPVLEAELYSHRKDYGWVPFDSEKLSPGVHIRIGYQWQFLCLCACPSVTVRIHGFNLFCEHRVLHKNVGVLGMIEEGSDKVTTKNELIAFVMYLLTSNPNNRGSTRGCQVVSTWGFHSIAAASQRVVLYILPTCRWCSDPDTVQIYAGTDTSSKELLYCVSFMSTDSCVRLLYTFAVADDVDVAYLPNYSGQCEVSNPRNRNGHSTYNWWSLLTLSSGKQNKWLNSLPVSFLCLKYPWHKVHTHALNTPRPVDNSTPMKLACTAPFSPASYLLSLWSVKVIAAGILCVLSNLVQWYCYLSISEEPTSVNVGHYTTQLFHGFLRAVSTDLFSLYGIKLVYFPKPVMLVGWWLYARKEVEAHALQECPKLVSHVPSETAAHEIVLLKVFSFIHQSMFYYFVDTKKKTLQAKAHSLAGYTGAFPIILGNTVEVMHILWLLKGNLYAGLYQGVRVELVDSGLWEEIHGPGRFLTLCDDTSVLAISCSVTSAITKVCSDFSVETVAVMNIPSFLGGILYPMLLRVTPLTFVAIPWLIPWIKYTTLQTHIILEDKDVKKERALSCPKPMTRPMIQANSEPVR